MPNRSFRLAPGFFLAMLMIAAPAFAEAVAPDDLESQAMKELALAPGDLTTGVLPTPATVRLRVEQVKNPIRPLAYRLGVSVQPYTPSGSLRVSDLAPYDLKSAGTTAMVALEAQWLPFLFSNTPGLMAGGFASVGYAQSSLDLRSPTGATIENTRLNSIKTQLGASASYQLPRSPLWSVHANLGVGRLTVIQSSASSFADVSTSLWFGSLGASLERSIVPNFSVYLASDFRAPVSGSAEGADVPRHNVLLGFLGNFD